MRARSCTIDSSCVIALDHLNLVPQLSLLFSIVLVPKAVREDLFKRRSTKDRLQSLFENFAFIQRCDGYEQGTVDFLIADLLSSSALRDSFESLRQRGIRLPWEKVNELLVQIGQPPL